MDIISEFRESLVDYKVSEEDSLLKNIGILIDKSVIKIDAEKIIIVEKNESQILGLSSPKEYNKYIQVNDSFKYLYVNKNRIGTQKLVNQTHLEYAKYTKGNDIYGADEITTMITPGENLSNESPLGKLIINKPQYDVIRLRKPDNPSNELIYVIISII